MIYKLTRILAIVVLFAAVVLGVVIGTGKASAAPGQCFQFGGFGGWCDGPMEYGGVFRHCENGMGIWNCYYVRPVPVEVDQRGWVPA